MGKFLKVCMIIGIICIGLGVAASAAGVSLGGLSQLKEQVLNGEWSFDMEDILGESAGIDFDVEPFFELEGQQFFDDGTKVEEGAEKLEYAFSTEGLTDIHMKSAGVTVKFMAHNGSEILVYASKTGKYQNYVRDNELSITVSGQSEKNLGEGLVEILIPQSLLEGAQMDMDIKASASAIELGSFTLNEAEFEISAGTVSWQGLAARELTVEMTAGTVNGAGTYITATTDIEMNAGSVELTGSLGAETELEVMAGKLSLLLENAYTDFNYDISCAGGSITVGEETLQGLGKELKQNNKAPNSMDIECSAGAVDIQFQ